MSSYPESLSHWISSRAPLNDKQCGYNAIFSEGNSAVRRRNPDENVDCCVCYTAHPLLHGEVWQVTLCDTVGKTWSDSLRIGITTALPDAVPSMLPRRKSERQCWNYVYSHNKSDLASGLPNLVDMNGIRLGFLITAKGDFHLYYERQHIERVASGLPVEQHLWGAVDVYGSCSAVKSELLKDPTEYLQAALKEGHIPHKDDLFLIHGPGGVGKSSLIDMFLGKQRGLARISTALANEALHLHPIRDVTTKMFTEQWEPIDIDRQARMVAHTSHHLLSRTDIRRVELDENVPTESRPFFAKPSSAFSSQKKASAGSHSSATHQQTKTLKKGRLHWLVPRFLRKSKKERGLSSDVTQKEIVLSEQLATTLKDDPDKIEMLLVKVQGELHSFVSGSSELFVYYSIRVVDSGGQPQFHEVVSIILPAVTAIVSVFKLSERLDVHGEVVFYKDGVLENDSYKSYLTNEQVIRHDLLAIQSEANHSGIEKMPNLAFVGTFLDKKHACPDETPDQKDERLHSMITEILPEDMQQCVISNGGSLRQVTFRLNTRTPGHMDYQTAGKLKEALMSHSRVKPKILPLKWCMYEVTLRKLMKMLDRETLSLQECEFIGYKLGFDSPSLKACLHYLREFHIISYYNAVPHIIFGSCQVILDKITELVTYSLKLKKGNRALLGAERKFHQQGILSPKILQSKDCSKHYKDKLFTINDLVKILKSLLIITDIGTGEFLMPCVLEVSDIYPSPQIPEGYSRSSFVLHFSKKSPMLGIYGCTIAYLLTNAGWKLLTKGGEVIQIARNSVTFELPGNTAGKLTFIDPLSSYFEVVLELSSTLLQRSGVSLLNKIKKEFFNAIEKALQTLNYEVRTPELSFLCPEQSLQCSIFPHLASLDESQQVLTCTKNRGSVFHPLTDIQKMWLGNEYQQRTAIKKGVSAPPISVSSIIPTLPQLLTMQFPERVGPKINIFGTILLKDDLGNKMANIRKRLREDPEEMTIAVLGEWLEGKGVDVTWEDLISVLRNCRLLLLADQIEMALEQL